MSFLYGLLVVFQSFSCNLFVISPLSCYLIAITFLRFYKALLLYICNLPVFNVVLMLPYLFSVVNLPFLLFSPFPIVFWPSAFILMSFLSCFDFIHFLSSFLWYSICYHFSPVFLLFSYSLAEVFSLSVSCCLSGCFFVFLTSSCRLTVLSLSFFSSVLFM